MIGYYAFWRYDKYPFFLGGTITKMHDTGTVETKEFGRGRYFRPVLIVPKKTGLEIQKTLERLERERDKAVKTLNSSFVRKLREAIPLLEESLK